MKLASDECHNTSLMICLHWFRWWLGAVRQQAITWAYVDPNICHYLVSLGHNELTNAVFDCHVTRCQYCTVLRCITSQPIPNATRVNHWQKIGNVRTKLVSCISCTVFLTHWGQGKMTDILSVTFSNAFFKQNYFHNNQNEIIQMSVCCQAYNWQWISIDSVDGLVP